MENDRNFYAEYSLADLRRRGRAGNVPKVQPAGHQRQALNALQKWYDKAAPDSGTILVLPTGAGKTFTAVRFLYTNVIPDGYKVLWLAHSHHLLEQAWLSLEQDLAQLAATADDRPSLKVRVVSGTKGHYPVHRIKRDDDVLIATLQTITSAYEEHHTALQGFVDSAKGRLFVVFDEAHHAPAPSYRKLVLGLKKHCQRMRLLGLTATPVYTDERKAGWLKKLFPQDIVFQVKPGELMAEGILARPVVEQCETKFSPEFDEREYEKWVSTFQDLPPDIIEAIASNEARNQYIANTYVENRAKFGKTIIFADRWYQCEAISEALRKRKVKTGTVFSHVDADPGTSDARNRRRADENTEVIQKFKDGKLDVVLNVRMLTEGTDVPDVQTVFLTRQTTSPVLLTQMVGRALRGPKFGGTDTAHIVFFIDEWEQLINWAGYDQLAGTVVGTDPEDYGKRPPVQFISIELVRKLVRLMDSGENFLPAPYLELLPVGWYRVDYVAQVHEDEAVESVRRLVMVFEAEAKGYDGLIRALGKACPSVFQREDVALGDVADTIASWKATHFADAEKHFGSILDQDIFMVARHIAQNGQPPRFFTFADRQNHDLDAIAAGMIDEGLTIFQADQRLRLEYENEESRYWRTLYPSYGLFKSQYDACVNRLLSLPPCPGGTELPPPTKPVGENLPKEIEDFIKLQVKEDDARCLACGSTSRLQVDHILPVHFGGPNDRSNLQTLCSICNRLKKTQTINFRSQKTNLRASPTEFPDFETPSGPKAGDPVRWDRYLRQCFNFFYRCGAVHLSSIGKRGNGFYHWHVELEPGNDPTWVRPFLPHLLDRIRSAKEEAGYGAPETITVVCPGFDEETYSA